MQWLLLQAEGAAICQSERGLLDQLVVELEPRQTAVRTLGNGTFVCRSVYVRI